MKLTNKEIYNYYQNIVSAFKNSQHYLPAKVNFYIHKNKQVLQNIVEAIDITREEIAQHYGKQDVENIGLYHIPLEDRDKAQQELNDLMNIQQEIVILKVPFDSIADLEFTPSQMEAIMFMIDESQV